MTEVYYNSRQLVHTLAELAGAYDSLYEMFLDMVIFHRENHLTGISHSRTAKYEILYSTIVGHGTTGMGASAIERFRDLLTYGLYFRENVKGRPPFARD